MLFLRKILIYFLTLGELIILYLLIIKPEKNIYWLVILFLLLIVLTRLATGKKVAFKNFLSFLFFIILFCASNVLYLVMIENIILSYFFIFFIALLSLFYFNILYNYIWLPEDYQAFSLVNYTRYLSFWNLYSFTTFCYVLVNVLNMSVWLTAFVLGVFSLIILSYNFSIENLNVKKNWRYFLAFFFLMVEIGWLIAWLPWSYYTKGFCFSVITYFILNYFIKNLKHQWLQKTFFWHLGVALFVIILILVTTRWF